MDSPACITWTSPASIAVSAAAQLHSTSQSDLHLAAAHTLASVAGGAATLFTHSGGIQAIAANGPVSLQAHTAPLEILADQAITVTSVNGNIEIKAQQKIAVQAGSSSITLEGSNITLACPGKISVKGMVHGFKGASTGEVNLPVLPDDRLTINNWIALDYLDPEGEPMADLGYKITFTTGQAISGKLDATGHAHHENVPESTAKVEYEVHAPKRDTPWDPLQQLVSAARGKLNSTQ